MVQRQLSNNDAFASRKLPELILPRLTPCLSNFFSNLSTLGSSKCCAVLGAQMTRVSKSCASLMGVVGSVILLLEVTGLLSGEKNCHSNIAEPLKRFAVRNESTTQLNGISGYPSTSKIPILSVLIETAISPENYYYYWVFSCVYSSGLAF
jgi:hypothetical protein